MKADRPQIQANSGRQPALSVASRRALRFAVMVAALCLLIVLVRGRIYVLREIEVTGNSMKSESEIAGLSGLRLGMSIFNVDSELIGRNLSADPYVELEEVSVRMPDTVVLHVKERSASAAVNCAGVIYLISEDGYILERLMSVPQNQGLIVVSGMDVSIGSQGTTIESSMAGQKKSMSAVLAALRESGADQLISELNVADLDNLYLVSESGIQILLGDETQLDQKLVWMRAVLEKLTQNGVMSGILDVSSGKNAVYADR